MSDLYRKVVVEHDDGLHHLEFLPVEPVTTLTVQRKLHYSELGGDVYTMYGSALPHDLPDGEYLLVEVHDEAR